MRSVQAYSFGQERSNKNAACSPIARRLVDDGTNKFHSLVSVTVSSVITGPVGTQKPKLMAILPVKLLLLTSGSYYELCEQWSELLAAASIH